MFIIAEEMTRSLERYMGYGLRMPFDNLLNEIDRHKDLNKKSKAKDRFKIIGDSQLIVGQGAERADSTLVNVTGRIGENVTLIRCSFADAEVNIPDNATLVNVQISNSSLKLQAEHCNLRDCTFVDSVCNITATNCLADRLDMRGTTIDCLCRYICIDGVTVKRDKDSVQASILRMKAPGKDVYINSVVVCNKGLNIIDNPKLLLDVGSRGYYYRPEERIQWTLGKDSVTITDGVVNARVINNGVLMLSNRLSGMKLISVGKDSRVNFTDNRLHWYAAQNLEEFVAGDNVVASLYNLKRTTKRVHVKDNFIGVIDKNTGTTRGDFKVVRAVHGERPRC